MILTSNEIKERITSFHTDYNPRGFESVGGNDLFDVCQYEFTMGYGFTAYINISDKIGYFTWCSPTNNKEIDLDKDYDISDSTALNKVFLAKLNDTKFLDKLISQVLKSYYGFKGNGTIYTNYYSDSNISCTTTWDIHNHKGTFEGEWSDGESFYHDVYDFDEFIEQFEQVIE